MNNDIVLAKNLQKLFKLACQHSSKYYLLEYKCHNPYLNYYSTYISYCIGNFISGNHKRVEKNNHKSPNNNSNTRSFNINYSKMP